MTGGREVDLHLDLLDKQIVDRDGRLCGNVDDLELSEADSGAVFVSALLVGPIALGPRFKGRLGRWITTLAQHAAGDRDRGPNRVDMSHVVEIDSAVTLDVSAVDVGLRVGDDWVRDNLIGRIPGARHESE